MPVIKGPARIISEPQGEVLGGGMCYLNAQEPERNAGTLTRLVWRDPAPVLSETETYLLEFMETGRWLRIRFQRVSATTCGPVIARFQGEGPLREE
ncbi:MAG: hypothetical protein HYY02_13835 [Chloroflexi bacterium]|nr:hypothetical protein [Chloroflexota bacterium]